MCLTVSAIAETIKWNGEGRSGRIRERRSLQCLRFCVNARPATLINPGRCSEERWGSPVRWAFRGEPAVIGDVLERKLRSDGQAYRVGRGLGK